MKFGDFLIVVVLAFYGMAVVGAYRQRPGLPGLNPWVVMYHVGNAVGTVAFLWAWCLLLGLVRPLW